MVLRVAVVTALVVLVLAMSTLPARAADLETETKQFINSHIDILRNIALWAFVLVFIGCGLMLLFSWGSPSAQAWAKKGLAICVFALVLIYFAPTIANWIKDKTPNDSIGLLIRYFC